MAFILEVRHIRPHILATQNHSLSSTSLQTQIYDPIHPSMGVCFPGGSANMPGGVGVGGGSKEKWSSQLAHILVWNGGFKIGKLCGCVCTQKGGQNERFTHNMPRSDMGTKLLWLQLHEAKAFEAKASASASWFQKLKASASASAS